MKYMVDHQKDLAAWIILVTLLPVIPYSAIEFCNKWFIFSMVARCFFTPSKSTRSLRLRSSIWVFWDRICSQLHSISFVSFFMFWSFCSVFVTCWVTQLFWAWVLFLALVARVTFYSRKSNREMSQVFCSWRWVSSSCFDLTSFRVLMIRVSKFWFCSSIFQFQMVFSLTKTSSSAQIPSSSILFFFWVIMSSKASPNCPFKALISLFNSLIDSFVALSSSWSRSCWHRVICYFSISCSIPILILLIRTCCCSSLPRRLDCLILASLSYDFFCTKMAISSWIWLTNGMFCGLFYPRGTLWVKLSIVSLALSFFRKSIFLRYYYQNNYRKIPFNIRQYQPHRSLFEIP